MKNVADSSPHATGMPKHAYRGLKALSESGRNTNAMMNNSGHHWIRGLIAVVVVMVLGMAFTPTEVRSANEVADLPRLAESGEFSEVLNRLRSDAHEDLATTSLIQDLESFEKHQEAHSAERQELFKQTIEKMRQLASQQKLDDALISAVDAHGLAEDPVAMLQLDDVRSLVAQTEAAANEAQEQGDWVEALNLYRLLNLLHDDFASYRPHVNRAARHVRALRIYAPNTLEKLYAARAERMGEDKPATQHQDKQPWHERFEGVKLSMFRQTLAQSVRRHVSDTPYVALLSSSLDALLVTAETQGLAETFSSFEDPDLLDEFCQSIRDLRDEIQSRDKPMDFLDATTVFDRVVAINDRTIGLPQTVLIAELTEGAMEALDDFSAVIWPSEKKSFSRNTRGKFSGVGISISIRDDRLVVVSPLEDTPAYQAGIRAGDVIARVDDRDTSSWSLDQAVREITGPKGSYVTLGIERPGEHDLMQFKLARAEIVIKSIRGWQRKAGGGWDYYIDRDHRIGYVRLSQFIPQTATDLDRAINQMEQDAGLDGLILDLRFNPGGLLSSAVEVTDRFIRSGPIVATVDADGKQTTKYGARPDHTHRPIPMVVLVNEGSASASEIVAGALQDYGRAKIVGSRSFGKGSVQDLFHLDRGEAYLKLTTQYYQLPEGRIIHREPDSVRWGIEPDVAIRMTTQQIADAIEFRQKVDVLRRDEDSDDQAESPQPEVSVDQLLTESLDPQLEAGLLIVKTRLVAQKLALAQRQ